MNTNNVGVIVLAGGESSRTAIPKLFFKFDQKKNFIEKIVDEYCEFGCDKIILVLNYRYYSESFFRCLQNNYHLTIKLNYYQEKGRFYSVKLGIESLDDAPFCFIQNIDNPFIDQLLLNELYDKRADDSYVVPVFKNLGGHPVLIGRDIIDRLFREKNTNSNLKDILKEFNRIEIEAVDNKVTANINSDEEYKIYFE